MPQAMLYEFRVSARATARPLFLKGAVLTCVGLTFGGVFWWTIVVPVLMFFPLLLGLATLYDAGVRALAGGEWHIRYDGEQLIWHAPAFAEKSFSVGNRDIDKIVARHMPGAGKRRHSKQTTRFTLYLRSGESHELPEQDGLQVEAIIAMLQEQGVPRVEAAN